ncbi:MAG: RNA polymerase sigma factor [Myxococcales bacterium]|nr:RNA polymerase sigma factor [Myxococcales bacterium]
MAHDTERTQPDAELVEHYRAGDREAFKTLAQRYWRSLFRLLQRYTRNADDAEDLLQKTLLRALNGLARLRGEVQFRPWLFRIALNTAHDFLRQRQRATWVSYDESLSGDAAASHESALIAREQLDRLAIAVDQLPPRQRDVLLLRLQQGLGYSEIAEILECSVSSAKVSFHHAMTRIKALVSEEER